MTILPLGGAPRRCSQRPSVGARAPLAWFVNRWIFRHVQSRTKRSSLRARNAGGNVSGAFRFPPAPSLIHLSAPDHEPPPQEIYAAQVSKPALLRVRPRTGRELVR